MLGDTFGMIPVRGGSGPGSAEGSAKASESENKPKKDWKPGDSVSVVLIRGDSSAASNGTVTWVGPKGDSLLAFGHSRMRVNVTHGDLIRAATGMDPVRSRAAAGFALMHVRHLLGQLGVTGDLHFLAFALLAPLEAMALEQQRVDGVSLAQIELAWDDLVARVVG